MKELAAYVLLVLGGNATPSSDDVKNCITSAGGEADDDKINTLITDLEGKNIHELLAKGENSLKACVGVSGGVGGNAGGGGGDAPAAAAAEAAKPAVEEVDALEGGMDMFGGGGGGGDY